MTGSPANTASAGPRRRRGRRVHPGLALVVAAGVVALVAGTLLVTGGPSPSSPPSATGTAGALVALAPDLVPLAVDGTISEADLAHDSRSDRYRIPGGAVPAGTRVTLRLRAAAGDLSEATVRVWDSLKEIQVLVPMRVVATERTGGRHGYDYWEATLNTLAQPTVLYYRFIVRDGPTTRYLEDDLPADGGSNEANDGGSGRVYAQSPDSSWQIDLYKPDFATPAWSHGAVAYQIFPDRFFNGDPSNDPSPTATPGTSGATRYRHGTVYGLPVLAQTWGQPPEGYCRAYQGVTCDEQPRGRDFYGGDLAGITAKLNDLADLGVTVLYLNPIFAAPSNHRYDTADYRVIDPALGTAQDFAALVAAARAKGMRVILDGVFNHVSSDSPYFDRGRQYAEVGACESAASLYRSWFTFRKPAANEPSPCAPSTPGGADTSYVGWFGFDTIPELVEQPATNGLFAGPDGVVRQWLTAGASGWRLDVMDNLSHGLVKAIRAAAKAVDPNALVLGEQWGDASPWLLGNEADTTMDYRFRRAVVGLVNGPTPDLDGAIAGLAPSAFIARMLGLQEDYPAPAFDSLLNLVDSHDTTRILWTLTPGAESYAAKTEPAALAAGKQKLRQLAALQLTWPGMASIYYGDEVGLTGQDDPDDRRTYPWGTGDTSLRDWYRTLARLRSAHASLRDGDLRFLLADDTAGTLAFGRRTDTEASITVLNLSAGETTVTVPLTDVVPNGTTLEAALGGAPATVTGGAFSVTLPALGSAVFITTPGTDLAPPAAPEGIAAAATPGAVALTWAPADGAARYRILRSVVAGGYEPIGTSDGPAYTDATPRNGTRYHYVVQALDPTGNVGPRSADADALPQVAIADARLDAPAAAPQPLSAVDPGTPIAALVRVDGVTGRTTPTIGIRAQLGFGPARTTPTDPSYRWSEMAFAAGIGGADRYVGSVRPEETGAANVVLRVSADGGATWAYADRGGLLAAPGTAPGYRADQALTLTALPGADTEAPPAPSAPVVASITDASLTLTWTPVRAPDLLRYLVSRSEAAGGPYSVVGVTTEPTFTDDTVTTGTTYHYVVAAQNTSFNRSAASPEVASAARMREVTVTFRVTPPKDTPKDATLFIAGDFQGWNPGKTPLTKAKDGTWQIALPFTEGATPGYKYTRGSWDAVEKGPGCEEIANRTATVTYGSAGTMVVEDAPAKWRDVANCG